MTYKKNILTLLLTNLRLRYQVCDKTEKGGVWYGKTDIFGT